MIQSSIPITVMPDANKTWVLGDGVESNRPATNFPGIAVDSNPFNRVVDRNVYVVAATRELW
jgi:hypothetical protein